MRPWANLITDTSRGRGCLLFILVWGGPSLLIGWLGGFDPGGMGLGLAIFFGALLLLATRQFASQSLRRPVVRRALVDALQVRLFSILVFPIALINDLVCGGLSVLAALVLFDSAGPFVVTTAATLIEGALLTVELALITYVAFARRRASGYALTPAGMCVGCGYELRGCTSNRCPECGRVAEPVA